MRKKLHRFSFHSKAQGANLLLLQVQLLLLIVPIEVESEAI